MRELATTLGRTRTSTHREWGEESTMSGRGPAVGRLVAEFGVIVMGVLVALLAESAWTERGDRLEEREVLGWISQDLAADSTSLAVDRSWVEMALPAAAESRDIPAGRDTLSATARLAPLLQQPSLTWAAIPRYLRGRRSPSACFARGWSRSENADLGQPPHALRYYTPNPSPNAGLGGRAEIADQPNRTARAPLALLALPAPQPLPGRG